MSTTVVNVRREEQGTFVYVGRARRSEDGYFGNPHALGMSCRYCEQAMKRAVHHSPEECMALFRSYFMRRIATDATFRARVLELRGQRLGCFCKRRDGTGPCHGDVIAEWVDAQPAEVSGG